MITENAIRRLAYAGGAQRLNNNVYDYIRKDIQDKLAVILTKCRNFLNYQKKRVVTGDDILFVFQSLQLGTISLSGGGKENLAKWSLKGFKRYLNIQTIKDISKQSIRHKIEIYNKLSIDYYLIPSTTFKNYIKNHSLIDGQKINFKFSNDAYDLLQEYTENYIIGLFNKTSYAKIKISQKTTIDAVDLETINLVQKPDLYLKNEAFN